MSGGGGGRIILRSMIRSTVSSTAVQENITPRRKARCELILATPESGWTAAEVRYLIRTIEVAEKEAE